MKNLKNLFAIVALVSVLGVGSSFASVSVSDNAELSRQCVERTDSWFVGLFYSIKRIFVSDGCEASSEQGDIPPTRKGKNAAAEQGTTPPGVGEFIPTKR